MSDENNTEETQAAVVTEPTVAEAPVKRGRGRPKGSKNKPKDPNAPVKPRKNEKAVAAPAPVTTVAPAAAVFVASDEDLVESEPAPVED